MTISIIPLQAIPNQTLNVNLSKQDCKLDIYQKRTGLYMDVYVSNTPVVVGVLCENGNIIVRDPYLNFVGDLAFYDLVGTSDPTYDALGSRYFLAYIV